MFNEAVGLYGRMQQDGRIESFDVTLLGASSVLNGYMALKGDAAQIQALLEDEEFQRVIIDATLIVDDLNVIAGYTNAGIAPQMAIYAEAIAKVPQRPERGRGVRGGFDRPAAGNLVTHDDRSRPPPRRTHRHRPRGAHPGPGRPAGRHARGPLERFRPPRAGRPRVAAALDAEACALRDPRVHLRGGPLPRL